MNAQQGDVHLSAEVILPLIGGRAKNNICSKPATLAGLPSDHAVCVEKCLAAERKSHLMVIQ